MRQNHRRFPKPIHEINPAITEWFAKIVEKLMAKDKRDRFESAGEIHKLLESCLSHVQQPSGNPLPSIPNLIPRSVETTTQGVPLMIKFAAGMVNMAILAMWCFRLLKSNGLPSLFPKAAGALTRLSVINQ